MNMNMPRIIFAALTVFVASTTIYGFSVTQEPEAVSAATTQPAVTATQSEPTTPHVTLSFDFASENPNTGDQFAVWVENDRGQLINQVFVTKFATTLEGKKDLDTLPFWAGKIRNHTSQQIVDATAGATPKSGPVQYFWNLTNLKGQTVRDGEYTIYMSATEKRTHQLNWKGTVIVKDGKATIASQPTIMPKSATKTDMISNLTLTAK